MIACLGSVAGPGSQRRTNIGYPHDRALSLSRSAVLLGGSGAQPKLTESTKHAGSPQRAAFLFRTMSVALSLASALAATMPRRLDSRPECNRPEPRRLHQRWLWSDRYRASILDRRRCGRDFGARATSRRTDWGRGGRSCRELSVLSVSAAAPTGEAAGRSLRSSVSLRHQTTPTPRPPLHRCKTRLGDAVGRAGDFRGWSGLPCRWGLRIRPLRNDLLELFPLLASRLLYLLTSADATPP